MKKVLVVEDEDFIREDIAMELLDCGYHVIEADNGVAGMEAIYDFKPDIVLSDIKMPIMGGVEMCIAIREGDPDYADTPFVFLSAYASLKHIEEGKAAGVDDYLTKPVDFGIMTKTIKKILAKNQ